MKRAITAVTRSNAAKGLKNIPALAEALRNHWRNPPEDQRYEYTAGRMRELISEIRESLDRVERVVMSDLYESAGEE